MKNGHFLNYSIGKKLGIIEAVIVLILMAGFTLFIVSFTAKILETRMKEDLTSQVISAKNILEVYSNDVNVSTEKLANVFLANFPGGFSIETAKSVKVGTLTTPQLKCGAKVVNLNFEEVDRFSKMTGGAATVFVRCGDDFVRISTSLKKEDGTRAVGTTLGKQHPGYVSLLKGESYLGRATLFGKDYSTKYLPVRRGDGEVIGILFVGYDMTDGFKYLKEKLKAIKIGKTGYIYALNSQEGAKYGSLLIHPALEGKNILDSRDDAGNEFIKEILTKKNGIIVYPWLNKELGETVAREKIVSYLSYDEWHTIIAAGAYTDELLSDAVKLRNYIIIASLAIAAILIILLNFFANKMVTLPLQRAVKFAQTVASGDLTSSVRVVADDEIGQLSTALNGMVANLKNMIESIGTAAKFVAMTAEDIAENSAQLERATQNQTSATDETSATMVQMSASIQTVSTNTDSLASNADEVSSSIHELGASSDQVAKSAEVMASSVAETSATIEQMTISIEKVARSSEDLASSVTETSSTVEQMTVSIDQVAGNAQELRTVVMESSTVVSQMAESIMHVNTYVDEADKAAKVAAKEGYAGQQAGEQAVAAMIKVAAVIEKTSESIITLGKRSEEIGNIVEVINQIADQTNLLALNAAIEAARAGDAGRGFAVVAEEVRKLAERSVAATNEIAEVIRKVQADTTESVRLGEIASDEAKASMELTTMAGGAFERIASSVALTSNLLSDISRMTAEQSIATTQVISSVERMSQSTEIVANAAREQALGGRQIRIAIERMNHISREVSIATREQATGGRQIRGAVENMNHVTGQVSIATREQSLSARQIVAAVNSMNLMIQSVAIATSEQKMGGSMIATAMESISDTTRKNLCSVEELSMAAKNLTERAVDLSAMVSAFKI